MIIGEQGLSDSIKTLNEKYMQQDDSVMIVVEEAGDAANMSSLQRARRFDPTMERTILVWNKLDKYYKDLSSETINAWFDGFGTLPANLERYCVTLPHWENTQNTLTAEQFVNLRTQMDKQDRHTFRSKGAEKRVLSCTGLNNFTSYLQNRVFQMFVRALPPVGNKLLSLKDEKDIEIQHMREELDQTDGSSIIHTVRLCGVSFAQALNDVMEGYQSSDATTRFTLDAELEQFFDVHGDFKIVDLLPFGSVEDYVEWLDEKEVISDVAVSLNGGAQYRRLMKETMVTSFFATLDKVDRANVIQAKGERRLSLSWEEVVVKMLSAGQMPIEMRINYAAARIKHFYNQQKDVIRDYMRSRAEPTDRPGFRSNARTDAGPGLVSGAFRLMEHNHIVRNLVLAAYENAAERQQDIFSQNLTQLSKSLLANPWLYLQSNTSAVWTDESTWWDTPPRDMEFLKTTIPDKIKQRQKLAKFLNDRIKEIPSNEDEQEEAITKVIATIQHVYDLVQTQIADQISHVAETFYKMPMMRQMETDMVQIVLPPDVDAEIKSHRHDLVKLIEQENSVLRCVEDCISRHNQVKNKVINSLSKEQEQSNIDSSQQVQSKLTVSSAGGPGGGAVNTGNVLPWDESWMGQKPVLRPSRMTTGSSINDSVATVSPTRGGYNDVSPRPSNSPSRGSSRGRMDDRPITPTSKAVDRYLGTLDSAMDPKRASNRNSWGSEKN
eukprot:GHVL01040641.1.p1 GENE.GHVL01040641.1~~GHVL01040641.1.p1  ORF type:complete len:721 (+),score=130.51 GHVL01040641.1:655-2817(+)